MSRILFLSQLLPYPPDAGPKIRSYYVIRHLAQRHQIVLLAFSRPSDTPEAIQHLEAYCETVETAPIHRSYVKDAFSLGKSLLTGTSFIIQRDWVPEMYAKVKEALTRYPIDQIHVDQLWMAQYAIQAKQEHLANHPDVPFPCLVMDEHNACFQVFQRLAKGEKNLLKRLVWEREWRALKDYEIETCRQFDRIVTVTQVDQEILQGLTQAGEEGTNPAGKGPTFSTIPICVDCEAVQPVQTAAGSQEVVHVGTMFWLPNIEGVLWFIQQVWPKVIEEAPQASFTVVGKNPPASILRYAKEDGTASQEEDKRGSQGNRGRIQVTGYVTDPRPYIERAAVLIVPLLSGSGMRVKIIDAWRWGIPVVSTTIGAEGIETIDGENILIADEPGDFARAVTRLFTEQELSDRLRANGRQWVEDHYNWQSIYKEWDPVSS